jgi:hypothetical protein
VPFKPWAGEWCDRMILGGGNDGGLSTHRDRERERGRRAGERVVAR